MKQYSISLRVWHPTLGARAIVDAIGLKPTVAQAVGEPRLTPKGNPVGRLNEESFCVFSLVDHGNGGFVEGIWSVLPALQEIDGAIRELTASEGVCELYVWVFPNEEANLGFVLDPALFSALGALGIRIAVELMLLD